MTEQAAFNKVYRWFIRDKNKPSYDTKQNLCQYRGPKVTRCAVGVLIPDKHYRHEMDESPDIDLDMIQSKVPNLQSLDIEFLMRLQSCHDNAAVGNKRRFRAVLKQRLIDFAERHHLTIPAG